MAEVVLYFWLKTLILQLLRVLTPWWAWCPWQKCFLLCKQPSIGPLWPELRAWSSESLELLEGQSLSKIPMVFVPYVTFLEGKVQGHFLNPQTDCYFDTGWVMPSTEVTRIMLLVLLATASLLDAQWTAGALFHGCLRRHDHSQHRQKVVVM